MIFLSRYILFGSLVSLADMMILAVAIWIAVILLLIVYYYRYLASIRLNFLHPSDRIILFGEKYPTNDEFDLDSSSISVDQSNSLEHYHTVSLFLLALV